MRMSWPFKQLIVLPVRDVSNGICCGCRRVHETAIVKFASLLTWIHPVTSFLAQYQVDELAEDRVVTQRKIRADLLAEP